ncbi:hypothetical protein OSB04_015063 [Centaurea solstitialis]|uniref:EF-hand domain-containing protein n=1 Tax=Centaurea solstitialis TaxID=347529 RepID=A0AA38TI78_9ASTR|nr:hypothetical protein OSB04_015063 [Centaurea solstitialis]
MVVADDCYFSDNGNDGRHLARITVIVAYATPVIVMSPEKGTAITLEQVAEERENIVGEGEGRRRSAWRREKNVGEEKVFGGRCGEGQRRSGEGRWRRRKSSEKKKVAGGRRSSGEGRREEESRRRSPEKWRRSPEVAGEVEKVAGEVEEAYLYVIDLGYKEFEVDLFENIVIWKKKYKDREICVTMHHSSAFLRKKPFFYTTRRALTSQFHGNDHARLISAKSDNQLSPSSLHSSSPSRLNVGWKSNYKKVESLLESLTSTVVVVGLSLGLCYLNSVSQPNSHVVYADSDRSTESEKKPTYLFGDAYRRKVFFKYEKRIRTQSPPEKVFEYFASQRSADGEPFMTPADLMRAVVPVFPPSGASYVREGSLKGEWEPSELHCPPSKFFMLFDTNNDGLISFAEYIFFVTLLSIPETSFSIAFKMFDLNNDGEIDKEEFKKVMALMRAQHRQGSGHRDGLRIGLKVTTHVENGGLVEYFFGKDGKSCLAHEKFTQFLKDLQNEILSLEFAHYDYKSRGTISAKDFALSMVASADMRHINKFLDRADQLNDEPSLKDIRITFEDFKKFAELRTKLRPLSLAIFSYGKVNGLLTKQDFQRAIEQVCGIVLSDNVINTIYYVFDVNRDGSLSWEEFLRVLQRREEDKIQPREAGVVGLISCWLQCSRNNCSSTGILL